MSFLFGDLTAAPFTTNFLEELRDAIDFCAQIADADQCIVTADAVRTALRGRTEADVGRADALAAAVLGAVASADKGEKGSAASTLATTITEILSERLKASIALAKTKLAEDIRTLEDATIAARADYFPVLEKYLLTRGFPGASEVLVVELVAGAKKDDARYTANVSGASDLGLVWTIEIAVPEEGTFSEPLRIDRIDGGDDLAIVAPKLTGLIKKEVKPKKQKIDRLFVQRLTDDGQTLRLELREEIGGAEGFDLDVAPAERVVTIAKIGDDSDDPTLGLFELAGEDVDALVDLALKLRASARALPKKRLVNAELDGLPFDGTNVEAQPKLVEIVKRYAAKLAPSVTEVVVRSRSKTELVLRRALDDGRREEIFMPKAQLREKIAPLDDAHRGMFGAIAAALSAAPAYGDPEVEVVENEDVAVRSEVPPSVPPVRRSSGNIPAVVVPLATKKVEAPPLVVKEEAPKVEIVGEEQVDAATLEAAPQAEEKVERKPAETIEETIEPPPKREKAPSIASIPPPSSRNAALIAALKHIRAIGKEGHFEEAFRQYATLLASASFAECRPEDQRQALKLMIHAKAPPGAAGDEMRSAFRAALPILQALVVKHHDPADYEMLGMSYVVLEQPEKATEIFKKALEIERARNPASDLCGTLMRRVSEL